MSLPVSISGRAEADLTHQYRWYLDHGGVAVAVRFLAAFDATAIRLPAHPELGRRRRFRAPELGGVRSFPVAGPFGGHLVFYQAGGATMEVKRVMHGARDLPRRLLEPPEA